MKLRISRSATLHACALVLGGAASGQSTSIVSVDAAGNPGDRWSSYVSISADGRFIAFESNATTLVPGDTNGTWDIFVRDLQTGTTERVSVASTGAQANGSSDGPKISADGRCVVFTSFATNLVAGDTNGVRDVFVHDRMTGTTERVSVSSSGAQANNGSLNGDISADGQIVAFSSTATNLVPNSPFGSDCVYVHNRATGATLDVSVSSGGVPANGGCDFGSLSADGQIVVFGSNATNLVEGDTNGTADVFVHRLPLGTTELVSLGVADAQANDNSGACGISSDGRFVVFTSRATNLVPGDTNQSEDVFVRDLLLGATERVSVGAASAQGLGDSHRALISAHGRFVSFTSTAPNLVAGDTNGQEDVFVRDRLLGVTERESISSTGAEGNGESWMLSISSNGRYVAFPSGSTNLVANDTNGWDDIFLRDRGISDCNGNGVDDDLDLQSGVSLDCDGDAIPDECDLLLGAGVDCNGNGVVDACDIAAGMPDCDGNGVPDVCDVAQGSAVDCDGNGLIDACEFAANPLLDADHDGRLDACAPICQPTWRTYIGGNSGASADVDAMTVFDDGTGPALYVGGAFSSAGGIQANRIAKWDGAAWSALGSGLAGGSVFALAAFDDGSGPALFAGGSFTSAGGSPAAGIAKWNGQSWSALPGTALSGVTSFAVYDHGSGPRLYIAANTSVLEWDGTTMASIPLAQPQTWIQALASYDDGAGPALYAGGQRNGEYSYIAKWNGIQWTQLESSWDGWVSALVLHDDGGGVTLYAARPREYGIVCSVLERSGSSWTTIGSFDSPVISLASFDDGSGPALFAGGHFGASGAPFSRIAKWDGTVWSALGAGTNGIVASMSAFDDGAGPALYVGGMFTTVGSSPALRIASWGLPQGCVPPGTVLCEPGASGTLACPCSNPPAGAGRGCDNSSATGGGRLSASGLARLGTDTLVFTTSSEKPNAASILLQGSASTSTGFAFGQGVRCVSGSLKRLYLKSAIGGSITAPGAGDPSASARSAALGSPIAPGTHRYYGVYYRDAVILGGCPATSGFNVTQQLDVLWHP